MSATQSFFICLELFLMFSSGGAYFGHYLAHCQFSSSDGHDAVFLEQFYANKVLLVQYNSTLGKLVGYTKKTKEFADQLNKSPSYIELEMMKTNLCKRSSQPAYEHLQTPVAPYVLLRSLEPEQSKHSHMIMCSVYDFYPKQIKVTWLRDSKEVKSDVTSTDEMPNGNWLYQLHSSLEFTPKPGEKITCMVEHASFRKTKHYDWEAAPDSSINKIVVGSAGLLLGFMFSAAGFIYYKKKSIERVAVPTNEVLYPEENL